uniref:Putative secreted protein n=1 Tax=Xenopsylla cheopis TaxID=163159 RepID=A0A6M2E0D0_XENCH
MSTGTAFNFTLIKLFTILFRTITATPLSARFVVVHSEVLRHNFTLSLPLYFTQLHNVDPAVVHFFLQVLQLDRVL